ncbi:MAG: hypothetical protein GEU73_06770 [Chloroflexi bacterium]|nr:hypothetical protein [Chloroflexota bacterium]
MVQAQPRTMVAITRVEPRSFLSKGILTGVFADGPNARRLYDAYNTTLNRPDRNNVELHMMKLVSDEVAAFPLYYNFRVDARVATLSGPIAAGDVWNIHEWQFR